MFLFKFLKSTWYFFIRKIIGSQKIFTEGKLMNRNFLVGVFRENLEKYHGTFSYVIYIQLQVLKGLTRPALVIKGPYCIQP